MPRRLSPREPRSCSGCCAEFVPTHGSQKFCGPSCRYNYKAGGVKACGSCGEEFFASHRNQGYCSDACRAGAWSPRKPERVWVCEVCFSEFKDVRERRFCSSPMCAVEANRRGAREYARLRRPDPLVVACGACGEGFTPRGRNASEQTMCLGCRQRSYPVCRLNDRPAVRLFLASACRSCGEAVLVLAPARQALGAESVRSRYCSVRCAKREGRKISRARRRASRQGAAVTGVVYRRKVFERDGWVCRLCRKPVVRDAVVPHPMAPTLDHILPLSLGGAHTYSNIETAHFICNATKSANVSQLSFAA